MNFISIDFSINEEGPKIKHYLSDLGNEIVRFHPLNENNL